LALPFWELFACGPQVEPLDYQIVRTLPHDPEAYTQGLVFKDGFLFESTGRYGSSSVRKTDPETGEILQITQLGEEYFGEGLALVGSELFQLTWKTGVAFVYDSDSLTLERTLKYDGEGWGLCFDGESLFMSDGTDRLVRRDPATFTEIGALKVTENGFPVWRLNELECVGNHIFANVYETTRILRIEKATGRVVSEIDGFPLSAAAKRAPDPGAVMNGIAYDPETGAFFLTGKLWQSLFEVRLEGSLGAQARR
jgi:glutamine cyclotransferase